MSAFHLGGCSSGLLPLAAALSIACSSAPNQALYAGVTDCDTTGTWAIFVQVGVEWQSGVIAPGAGTVKQWIMSTTTLGPDGKVRSSGHACGIGAQNVLLGSPWFSTIAVPGLLDHEWTGVEFLPQLFDSGTLEDAPIPMNISSADPRHAEIGDTMITSPSPFAFGLRGLPLGALWPKAEDMAPYLFDSDGDSLPAITGLPFQGPVPGTAPGVEFQNPRLNITDQQPPRASKLFLALRTRAGLQGKLTQCNPPRLEGTVTPHTLTIETRNVACLVQGTDAPCSPEQSKFIDDNLPAFVANDQSRWVGVKVAPGTTCKAVREFDY